MEITSLLNMMKEKKASDLFITVGLPPSMKVDGRIAPISQNALTPDEAEEIVLNMMTPAQRDEFEATRECQFAVSETGVGRFRASAFYQRNHPGVILRRIDTYPEHRGAEAAAHPQEPVDDQARPDHLHRCNRYR